MGYLYIPRFKTGRSRCHHRSAPWLASLALLTGCAGTEPFTGSGVNSLIDIQYGTIEQVQQVQMKANYRSGVLLGGGLGALATMHYSGTTEALATAGSALLGALVAKERAGTAERYTIRLVNGNTVSIVWEAHNLDAGDCVAVEQGRHANLRRVNPQLRNTTSPQATYPQAHAAEQQAAADWRYCEAGDAQGNHRRGDQGGLPEDEGALQHLSSRRLTPDFGISAASRENMSVSLRP